MPTVLGWILMIGGLGYIANALLTYLIPYPGPAIERLTIRDRDHQQVVDCGDRCGPGRVFEQGNLAEPVAGLEYAGGPPRWVVERAHRADTAVMADCCDPEDLQSVFTRRFARRTAKRYRTRGLSPAAARIVEFVTDHGVQGASVLEIGGGVGQIQVELLRRGASQITNLELSTQYEDEAARLLADAGMDGRVHRRFLDIAREQERVEPADVVVLHRVVCCYPDFQGLLSAAAQRATRVLVYSHPPDNAAARAVTWSENVARRLRGNTFRGYVHAPAAMIAVAEADGLQMTFQHHSWDWDVVGLVR